MTKYPICGVIAAALSASIPAVAQVAPGAAANPRHAMKAPKSRAEVQTSVARHFARMDADRDGFVTQPEAEAAQAKRGERSQQRSEKRAIQHDPATIFARLDGNKDGTITRAEADAARTARVVAKGKSATAHAVAFGGLFERADSNRDGNISRAEFDAAPPMGGMHGGKRHAGMKHGPGGRMFAMGDANKDGRMSLAEAQQAALVRFDRSDINRDGQVTPEERRQGREQRRTQRQPG